MAWIHWDPPKEAFTIPYFNMPVMWYGIIFALGFVLGYYILIPILRKILVPAKTAGGDDRAIMFADRITWLIVIGTVVGARLGHVFFYDWPYYAEHPWEIIMIRNGGLASHGGTIGVILSLLLFLRWYRKDFPETSMIMVMDVLVIPTAVVATCIRIANFFNQEILGYETTLPWGIIFGHPSDGSHLLPRHPVQLYEALAYFITFVVLYSLWRKYGTALKPGLFSGIFFVMVFGFRFFIEFLKTEQTSWMDHTAFQMGQLLSIPFVLLGCWLIYHSKNARIPKTTH